VFIGVIEICDPVELREDSRTTADSTSGKALGIIGLVALSETRLKLREALESAGFFETHFIAIVRSQSCHVGLRSEVYNSSSFLLI
jgi:hypothetical protein